MRFDPERVAVCVRALLIALVTLWVAAPPASADSAGEPADGERRIALVIGNGAYRNVPALTNPAHDAELMADTLVERGFQLVGGKALIDADKPAMEQAIRDFGQALKGGAVGLFYYSGHGIQMKGTNYLIPVSANVVHDTDVKYELVDIGFVLEEMADADNRLNIIVLDACRNNPFAASGTRAIASGLGQMMAPAGTVIGYATQPDSVAADGTGANSPYTAALVATIREPGLDLFATFNEVGLQVKQATGGRQQPWVSASPIEGRFFFSGAGKDGQEPAAPVAAVDSDALFWDSIKNSTNSADFKDYLERFPDGRFVTLAQRKLADDCVAFAAPSRSLTASDAPKVIAACRAAPHDSQSDASLARALEAAGQDGEAVKVYARAADEGSATAQAALGARYAFGRGLPHDDATAAQWYRKAAEQGDASAQAALGTLYHQGRAVARDDAEAARWWRKAAEQGNVQSQRELADALADGRGVLRDQGEAIRWYRKAAEQGDSAAQYNLGWIYQFGLGVTADRAEAGRWYHKAADQGNERAKEALGRL
jgi:uncharacterized caspase-like protein